MGQGRMICLIAIRLHPPVTTTSRIGLPKGRSEAPGHLISTSLEAMRQVRGQLDELCDVFSPGWLQRLTQSAEVNATFAVSPAKPPDFVAVGPAPGPRAGRGRARRPVSGMLTPAPVGLLQSLTQSAPAHRSTACGSREGLSTTSSRGTFTTPGRSTNPSGRRARAASTGHLPPRAARGYELTWLAATARSAQVGASKSERPLGRMRRSSEWLRSQAPFCPGASGSQ